MGAATGLFHAMRRVAIGRYDTLRVHLIYLLPTGSEEKEVLGVGSNPVAILPLVKI